jgi:Stage II sporulation protein E (SpoIIE)
MGAPGRFRDLWRRPGRCAGRMGSLVGVLDAPSFSDTTTDLQLGDVIVMYTEGVTEARSKGGVREHRFA